MGKGCRRRGVEGGRRVPGLTPGTQSSCAFEHLASWSSICRDADLLGGALPILALTYSASASPFAAFLACIYGSALRWCGAHRPTVFCAATTWVLGAAAARGCADFGTGAHGAFHVPADCGVAVALLCLFRMGWLPFGFDWRSFPFVAREFQPTLLARFPDQARLRAILRTEWVCTWDEWGDAIVRYQTAATPAAATEVADRFFARLEMLLAEQAPAPSGELWGRFWGPF